MIAERIGRRNGRMSGRAIVAATVVVAIVAGRAVAATRPTDEPTPFVLATHLYAVTLVVGLLLLCAAIGRTLLRRIGLTTNSRIEQHLFALGLGLGVIANVVLAVGLLGLLNPPVLVGAMAALAVIARRELTALLRELPAAFESWLRLRSELRRRDRVLALVLPLAELLFAALLLLALVPPTANDVLMYHLGAPRRFLDLGRIAALPEIQQANMPLTINLLYLLGLAFGSDSLGSVLHLTFAGLVAAATFSFGRHFFDARVGLMAAAIFISTLLLAIFAAVPNVEYGFAFFDFLAVYAFFRWHQSDHRSWLLVSGMMVGCSLGSKLFGGISAAALGIGLLVLVLRSRGRLGVFGMLGLLLTFAVPAGLIAAPWYLKNWVWFGNPLWPLMGRSPDDYNFWIAYRVRYGGGLLGELLAPLRVFIEGSVEYSGVRPPFALLFLPLYLFVPKHRLVSALIGLALLHVVIWMQGNNVLRYLVQALPELSLATAYVLAQLGARGRFSVMVSRFTNGFVLASLMGTAILTVVIVGAQQPFAQLIGVESREAYLDRELHNNPIVRELNQGREPVSKVLLIGDNRAFYLNQPIWEDVSLEVFQRLVAAPDAPAARAILAEYGVSHVLVNYRDLDWFMAYDDEGRLRGWWSRFEASRGGYLEPITTNEDSTLYRVRP